MKITPRRILVTLGVILYTLLSLWCVINWDFESQTITSAICICWAVLTGASIIVGIWSLVEYMDKNNLWDKEL